MFASASHEFRTPLNAIINSFSLLDSLFQVITQIVETKNLQRKEIEKVQNSKNKADKFIKIGRNSSVLLLSLVDDILDLSKMEAGTFKMNIDKFKITPMLENVYSIFEFQ